MDTLISIGIALCMVALLVMLVRNYRQLPGSKGDPDPDHDPGHDDPRRRFKS